MHFVVTIHSADGKKLHEFMINPLGACDPVELPFPGIAVPGDPKSLMIGYQLTPLFIRDVTGERIESVEP